MARLSADRPSLHPDCEITESCFGAYVEIGTFASIAAFSRIGATDHPPRHSAMLRDPKKVSRLGYANVILRKSSCA